MDIVDISIVLGDHLRHLRERARLIHRLSGCSGLPHVHKGVSTVQLHTYPNSLLGFLEKQPL